MKIPIALETKSMFMDLLVSNKKSNINSNMTDTPTAFDQNTLEYDNWFDKHPAIYQSEILALQQAVPVSIGVEIAAGSGRFAELLNIKDGVEPTVVALANQLGIKVIHAVAEKLSIENQSYDFATMVTAVCFLNDIPKAFLEMLRILKPKGIFAIGMIDGNSEFGKKYE